MKFSSRDSSNYKCIYLTSAVASISDSSGGSIAWAGDSTKQLSAYGSAVQGMVLSRTCKLDEIVYKDY